MKRSIWGVVLILILFIFSVPAWATPKVFYNGNQLNFDVPPTIEQGRTLVPLRAIFEALGANVDWDSYTNTAIATKSSTTVRVQIGKNIAIKNNQQILLDVASVIRNGRTLVPLRFVSEAFGADVKWDAQTESIWITEASKANVNVALEPSQIYNIASPAIVMIELFDENNELVSLGSGFIVDDSGIIVTNYHVIDGGYSVIVKLTDGRELNVVEILNYDVDRDVAILKVKGDNIPIVKMGDSEQLINGQKVVAIGNPHGLENTITDGIISQRSREMPVLPNNYKFIQTSAAISPGSSGGALLNTQAEVIGVTTMALMDAQNLNFAIPINDIKPLLKPTQGISLEQLSTNLRKIIFTAGNPSYLYHGKTMSMDVAPYIKHGQMFIPVRYIVEALDIDENNVLFDGASGVLTLIKNDVVVQFTVGKSKMIVNGRAINIESGAEIFQDRTFLPLRYVAQALNYSAVEWSVDGQKVVIVPEE